MGPKAPIRGGGLFRQPLSELINISPEVGIVDRLTLTGLT